MPWIEYIKYYTASRDKAIFTQWERNQIDTKQCIEMFRINNKIPTRINIDKDKFEYWLNSLGWKRGY